MEPRYGKRPNWTPNGPTVERIPQLRLSPVNRHVGGALTPQQDLYLGVVVTLMFLAGCVFAVVIRYQRSHKRKRWE